MLPELAIIFDRNTGFQEEKKRKMVQPVAKKNYGHIQHRNFSSFQYDGM